MAVLTWLVAIGVALVCAVTSYGIALGRGTEIVTPVWFAVPDILLASLVTATGVLLDRRGHGRTARWVLAMAFALMAYAAVAGTAAALRPGGSPVTTWVMALEGAWYLLPITLCGAACLVAAEELLNRPGALGWAWQLPAGLALVAMVTGLGVVAPEPYPELAAPWRRPCSVDPCPRSSSGWPCSAGCCRPPSRRRWSCCTRGAPTGCSGVG